jgi:hypothetical protein
MLATASEFLKNLSCSFQARSRYSTTSSSYDGPVAGNWKTPCKVETSGRTVVLVQLQELDDRHVVEAVGENVDLATIRCAWGSGAPTTSLIAIASDVSVLEYRGVDIAACVHVIARGRSSVGV